MVNVAFFTISGKRKPSIASSLLCWSTQDNGSTNNSNYSNKADANDTFMTKNGKSAATLPMMKVLL